MVRSVNAGPRSWDAAVIGCKLRLIHSAGGKLACPVRVRAKGGALRWLTQQGIIVIPGSGKPERQEENFDVLDFSLSPAEMAEIATQASRRP